MARPVSEVHASGFCITHLAGGNAAIIDGDEVAGDTVAPPELTGYTPLPGRQRTLAGGRERYSTPRNGHFLAPVNEERRGVARRGEERMGKDSKGEGRKREARRS